MELNESQNVERFVDFCPTCNIEKVYKTRKNLNLCKGKNCRSCTNSITRGGIGNARPLYGKKKCLDCNLVKDVNLFYKTSKGGVHAVCKLCSHLRSSKYHTQHYRYAMYGLTKEEFLELSNKQDNKCAICLNEVKLVVDHDHNTGEIKGLLCKSCNVALGLLKEDPEVIQRAVEYLKNSIKNE